MPEGLTNAGSLRIAFGMILPWIIAACVPLLAVWGWAWLLQDANPVAAASLDDPMLLLVRFFLAAAPLVALAAFSLVNRARPHALETVTLVVGFATLLLWGWYYTGAPGLSGDSTGLILLASPVVLGLLGILVYSFVTRRDA